MRICVLLIVLMFIVSLMEAFGIGLLYPLINIIGNPDWLEKHQRISKTLLHIGINSHRKLIIFSSITLLLFYFFKNFLILLQGKIQISFSTKNQLDYSKRLYSYYMKKDYIYHLNTNISIFNRNIGIASLTIFSEILVNTFQIITNFVTCFVIGIFIAYMDWFIALCVVLFVVPLIFFMLKFFRKKIGIAGELQNNQNVENFKWINQGFSSIKETKVKQCEDFFIKQYNESYTVFAKCQYDYLTIQRYPKSLIELITIGGILLLIAVKMLFTKETSTLIPTLGVLALAAVRLMPALNQIVAMFNQIKFKMPLLNEMFDDLMIVRDLKNADEQNLIKSNRKVITFTDNICVKHLSFRYPGKDYDVFDDVSFTIPKGSFVGIVGPSGAGKTTFVDILLGLLPATKGNIFVDGADINDSLSTWLNHISYVPQSIYLIDGSIKENVAFGIDPSSVNDERIQQVLKMAELYDFVQTLPDKENSSVGDRGARLSGGQRQRIGIARALYSAPSILVLDEATSALDNETEKQITETILKLKREITIIAIAHRLSTLENCDFKIKFEGGKATVC